MIFRCLTIFPDSFRSYLNEGILKRAQDKGIIRCLTYNLRDWTKDRHRSVDDAPYGGGAGMLMKIEPLYLALRDIKRLNRKKDLKRKIVLLSASGKKWDQSLAERYAKLDELIIVCGRYEGVDARIKKFVDTEISIGDYVLSGGELPAMVMIDSISRLLPGVLGNRDSLIEESHNRGVIGEYPQYTRPEVFQAGKRRLTVPKALLSGDHAKIKAWREKKTKINKPA